MFIFFLSRRKKISRNLEQHLSYSLPQNSHSIKFRFTLSSHLPPPGPCILFVTFATILSRWSGEKNGNPPFPITICTLPLEDNLAPVPRLALKLVYSRHLRPGDLSPMGEFGQRAQVTKTKAMIDCCPRAIDQASFSGSTFLRLAWDKSMTRQPELARKVRSSLATRGVSRGTQFAWTSTFRLSAGFVLGSGTTKHFEGFGATRNICTAAVDSSKTPTSTVYMAKNKIFSRVRSEAVVLHT